MKLLLAIAMVAAVGGGAAQAGPSRFDLKCTINRKENGKPAPAEQTIISIDLDASKSYVHGAEQPGTIKVTTTEIIFPSEVAQITISRLTGEYFQEVTVRGGSQVNRSRGTCAPAPYTGMPKVLF